MLMIKIVAGLLLLLGSGLIFRALVAMDAPSFRPRPIPRRPTASAAADDDLALTLRRAA